jgi:hypothetical protein
MLRLRFGGWFQCRLATDPDPSDEPRGVSGSIKALPGEPDLDRIIRLQPPAFSRSHTRQVGVEVREVRLDGELLRHHPLAGAAVNLLGDPVFKGENGVVAEDGKEPIVPFIFRVASEQVALTRACRDAPAFTEFPYPGLQALGIVPAPGRIADATGIDNFQRCLDERVARLKEDKEKEQDPTCLENIKRRIAILTEVDGSGQRTATRSFGVTLPYLVPLAGDGSVKDPDGRLGANIDLDRPWTAEFWMGGWDPDAMCAFMQGYLSVPLLPGGVAEQE